MKALLSLLFMVLLCISCEKNTGNESLHPTNTRSDSLRADTVSGDVGIGIVIDTTENEYNVNLEI